MRIIDSSEQPKESEKQDKEKAWKAKMKDRFRNSIYRKYVFKVLDEIASKDNTAQLIRQGKVSNLELIGQMYLIDDEVRSRINDIKNKL